MQEVKPLRLSANANPLDLFRVFKALRLGSCARHVDDAADIIQGFFREREVGVISVTPGDFLAAFNAALDGKGRIAGDSP